MQSNQQRFISLKYSFFAYLEGVIMSIQERWRNSCIVPFMHKEFLFMNHVTSYSTSEGDVTWVGFKSMFIYGYRPVLQGVLSTSNRSRILLFFRQLLSSLISQQTALWPINDIKMTSKIPVWPKNDLYNPDFNLGCV